MICFRSMAALAFALLTCLSAAPSAAGNFQVQSLHGVAPGAPLEEAIAALEAAGFEHKPMNTELGYTSESAEGYEGAPEIRRIYHFIRENLRVVAYALRDPLGAEAEFHVLTALRWIKFDDTTGRPKIDAALREFQDRAGVSEPVCEAGKTHAKTDVFALDEAWNIIPIDQEDCDAISEFSLPEAEGVRFLVFSQAMVLLGDDLTKADNHLIVMTDLEQERLYDAIMDGSHGKPTVSIGDF